MSDTEMILCTTCRKVTPHVVGMTMGGEPLRIVLTCEICGSRLETAPPPPRSAEG